MLDNLVGLSKNQLPTPCLVVDKSQILANINYMQSLAHEKNLLLRPHAKTHKCSQIAKLQLDYGACGISVTKVSEALIMAQNGITGILITSPIVSQNKIELFLQVHRLAPDTILVVDNLANAKYLNEVFKQRQLKLNVLLDIDGGIGRTGVKIINALKTILELVTLENLQFKGIQCYAGHLQHINDLNIRRTQSHQLLQQIAKIRDQLSTENISCEIISGSGTGTFSIDAEVGVLTEIQPGSYTVMDQEYDLIAYKEHKFGNAMTMLTTVISTNQDTHVTVDAGTKALYKVDTLPQIISHPHLTYDWNGFGDEHGKVTISTPKHQLPILGTALELIVAHCDPTINLFDQFYITENNIVTDIWPIDARGCCI